MSASSLQVPLVGAAVVVASALAGCTGGQDADPAPRSAAGGTLVYFVEAPIDTLDPQRLYAGREITNLGRTVYRSLVAYPASADLPRGHTPVPDLATDTGTSTNGGRQWSFQVKDGVTWEDGRPVSCEDFRYGASRAFATDVVTGGPNYFLSYLDIPIDASTGLPAYTGPYSKKGQELYDEAVTCHGSTITYRFRQPWPDFPHAIASLHLADPYRQDKDRGARSRYEVFSNGPYRLEGAWNKNGGGTLVRNERYDPGTDSPAVRRALPDRIEFHVGLTAETQYDRLVADRGADEYAVTGDLAPPSAYGEIRGVPSRVVRSDSPYVFYLVPHFRTPAMRSPAVREALAVATDSDGCVTALGGELAATAAESIVNPSVTGYRANPAFDGPNSGDPEAARGMLADAGADLPVPITFTYLAGETNDLCAAALKDTWDRAGFEVTLEALNGGVFPEAVQSPHKDTDVMMFGWGADWPSAITVTPPLFDSRPNLSRESDGQDAGAYDSAAFNALVDEARRAADLRAQTDALQRADLQLGEDVAYIPVAVVRFVLMHGSKVTHYVGTPASSGYPDLGAIGVAG